MANFSDRNGLPTTIHEDSITMENKTIEENTRRPTSGRICHPTVLESGDHSHFRVPKQRLPVELFYNPRTYQTSPNFGLYNSESIFTSTTLQDGGHSSLERDNRAKRLYLQGGLERCVCGNINPSGDSQKYLTFMNNGTVYQYTSLAFGLSIAPRIFSKIMRYALEPLRAKALGFLINEKKSVLLPSKSQEFLGFLFNTKTMKISLPQPKINKLLRRIHQAEKPILRSCRWIASLLGKMTAVIPAIGEALLHIRHLQRDLAKSLHLRKNNWDKPCNLSHWSQQEMQWWKQFLIQKNGLPIQQLPLATPEISIFVDASDSGWGIYSTLINTSGFWSHAEKEVSINVRELKTIYYAILLHTRKLNLPKQILIYSDNMTALKYVTKAGGTASFHLQDLAVKIQEICN
jgi:hypothetical protein